MIYQHLFDVFAFVLGACVGSFVNVCIYRLPLNLSVNQPRRSFCPSCKTQIPWHQNLPLVSWLALRGRCANCGARIAFRYFAVELLTALLFLIIWKAFPWQIAIAYWGFVALVIAATFIDFEHYIIPDEITIGGTIAGLIASTAVPQLMTTDRRLNALLISAASAAVGYALLWLVLEGGKLVFGKKRIRFEKSAAFTWARHGDDADFVVGDEKSLWSDFFARENDQLLLHCSSARIAERRASALFSAGAPSCSPFSRARSTAPLSASSLSSWADASGHSNYLSVRTSPSAQLPGCFSATQSSVGTKHCCDRSLSIASGRNRHPLPVALQSIQAYGKFRRLRRRISRESAQ